MIFVSLNRGRDTSELYRVLNIHHYDLAHGNFFTLLEKSGQIRTAWARPVWKFHTGAIAELLTLVLGSSYRWKIPLITTGENYHSVWHVCEDRDHPDIISPNYPWTDMMIIDSILEASDDLHARKE